MNPLLAAGLFDSPWVVVALIIGSALANWLAKRRQEKPSGPPPEEEAAPAASKPAGEFNLEETLRRLMGEEPPPSAPPVIPRAARGELPPAPTWQEEELLQPEPARMNEAAEAKATPRPASKMEAQAAQRFEQLNEQGRHPATVVSYARQRPARKGARGAARWRNSRSVRQAFVASLIFAPPKSFEP